LFFHRVLHPGWYFCFFGMKKKISKPSPQRRKRANYDCSKCPGYCCSVYELVVVDERDVTRLARHFQMDREEAIKKFTKLHSGERVLRRKADPVLGSACRFLDLENRRCTVYEARPNVCRGYPPVSRYTFYDMLKFHRKFGDDDTLPLVTIGKWRRPE